MIYYLPRGLASAAEFFIIGVVFTPRAESPEGYCYHGFGRRSVGRSVVGRSSACAMSVVSHFFIQFFSYDPEISHECSLP